MTDLLATKSLENKDEWIEWRKTLGKETVFGSQFPVWFGLGYESLRSVVDTLHGRKAAVDKDSDMFLQRAMKHGTDNEPVALDMFYEIVAGSGQFIRNELGDVLHFLLMREIPSKCYSLKRDVNAKLALTPDAVLQATNPVTGNSSLCIIEVKCPFREQHKYDSVQDWVTAFRERYPLGYPSAFLQAALYASVEGNCREFFTVFYFRHDATNEHVIVVHGFRLDDDSREFFLNNAQQFSACLARGDENLRVPSSRKKQALETQKKTQFVSFSTKPEFISFSDEQDSHETGN